MTARISKVELTLAIKAVQDCGLNVCQVSFDKNGLPVVICGNSGEMREKILDDLINKPSHEIQSLDEWKAKEMRVMLKGIHKLSRVNAKGETITYYYAWRGGPRIEAKPGTEAFLIEYASHICTLETNGIETLNNLIDHYLASPEYSALAISTKQSHQYAFRQIRKDYGSLPIHLIDAHGMKTELRNWRNKFVDRPRTADSLLNSFKRVLSTRSKMNLLKPIRQPG